MLKWGVAAAQLYNDCRERHRRTVESWPKSNL